MLKGPAEERGILALSLHGMSWPVVYVTLLALHVLMHYLFVSQSSQVLALFVGSGYLPQPELYRLGALITVCSFIVFHYVGTPWLLLVTR